MARILIIIILIILIAGILFEIIVFLKDKRILEADLKQMREKIEELEKENNNLQAQIDYFSSPENLEKELKARFNYKKPGEQMMIIVP